VACLSLLVSGRNVELSCRTFQSVQVSPDMSCLIEHKEIRCLPCQLQKQSVGALFGRQCQLNDPVLVNLFNLVDVRSLQVGAEKLTEGRGGRRILKG
jgi:hypothetical protein